MAIPKKGFYGLREVLGLGYFKDDQGRRTEAGIRIKCHGGSPNCDGEHVIKKVAWKHEAKSCRACYEYQKKGGVLNDRHKRSNPIWDTRFGFEHSRGRFSLLGGF